LLAVRDSGCGMSPEVQARIFEPFYTTKEVGKGTGLGLSTVYGVVKQNGGYVTVDSEMGRGTTFRVYLPVSCASPDRKTPPTTPATAITASETILLAEDDRGTRQFVRRVLEEQGYTVLEAHDPAEAEAIASRHPGAINLLVTDVVMPGMSGPALAQHLISRRQRMKVLFISGYALQAGARPNWLSEKVHFLQKPFGPDLLAREVREILDT